MVLQEVVQVPGSSIARSTSSTVPPRSWRFSKCIGRCGLAERPPRHQGTVERPSLEVAAGFAILSPRRATESPDPASGQLGADPRTIPGLVLGGDEQSPRLPGHHVGERVEHCPPQRLRAASAGRPRVKQAPAEEIAGHRAVGAPPPRSLQEVEPQLVGGRVEEGPDVGGDARVASARRAHLRLSPRSGPGCSERASSSAAPAVWVSPAAQARSARARRHLRLERGTPGGERRSSDRAPRPPRPDGRDDGEQDRGGERGGPVRRAGALRSAGGRRSARSGLAGGAGLSPRRGAPPLRGRRGAGRGSPRGSGRRPGSPRLVQRKRVEHPLPFPEQLLQSLARRCRRSRRGRAGAGTWRSPASLKPAEEAARRDVGACRRELQKPAGLSSDCRSGSRPGDASRRPSRGATARPEDRLRPPPLPPPRPSPAPARSGGDLKRSAPRTARLPRAPARA
mgnify:CR=1 FL=1